MADLKPELIKKAKALKNKCLSIELPDSYKQGLLTNWEISLEACAEMIDTAIAKNYNETTFIMVLNRVSVELEVLQRMVFKGLYVSPFEFAKINDKITLIIMGGKPGKEEANESL